MDVRAIVISSVGSGDHWIREVLEREQEIMKGEGFYKGFNVSELIEESEPVVLKENRASRRRQKFGKKRK